MFLQTFAVDDNDPPPASEAAQEGASQSQSAKDEIQNLKRLLCKSGLNAKNIEKTLSSILFQGYNFRPDHISGNLSNLQCEIMKSIKVIRRELLSPYVYLYAPTEVEGMSREEDIHRMRVLYETLLFVDKGELCAQVRSDHLISKYSEMKKIIISFLSEHKSGSHQLLLMFIFHGGRDYFYLHEEKNKVQKADFEEDMNHIIKLTDPDENLKITFLFTQNNGHDFIDGLNIHRVTMEALATKEAPNVVAIARYTGVESDGGKGKLCLSKIPLLDEWIRYYTHEKFKQLPQGQQPGCSSEACK